MLFERQSRLSDSQRKLWLTGFLVLIPLQYLLFQQDYATLLTVFCLGTVVILSIRSRLMAILVVFAYLVLLGDIRRITTSIAGYRPLDPLLLVGAGFAVYFAIPLLIRVRLTDPLSKAVMALMTVMILQMFNPKQGPVSVGISGALFSLVPVLWFWIGRRYGSDRALVLLLYRVLLPLGVLCAVLGICQTYIGFFPWEEAWAKGFGAVYLLDNGRMRPFGFSSSSAEYGSLLLIAAVIACAGALAKRKICLVFLPVVGAAMALSAMRGPIVRMIFGAAMMWAVRGKDVRTWIPKLVFAVATGMALLSYSASSVSDSGQTVDSASQSSADVAQHRVTEGLAHPFEAKHSTAGIHFQLFLGGVLQGFTNPTGNGLGSTTIASGKFGNGGYSSEVDISDAFMGMGFLGGLLYVFVILSALRRLPSFLRSGSLIARLPVAGLLAALLGAWIAVGQYGTAPVAFFCIGTLVHRRGEDEVQAESDWSRTSPAGHFAEAQAG